MSVSDKCTRAQVHKLLLLFCSYVLVLLCSFNAVCSAGQANEPALLGRIDRKALVTRHNVTLTKPDPLTPLSVGNGEFAFTADITGLQSFPQYHDKGMPLGTLSQWGWHTSPRL
jgi:hypothetical protein